MSRREIPYSPEYMQYLMQGEEMNPLDFLIMLEEIELKLKTQTLEIKIEIKKVKTNEHA